MLHEPPNLVLSVILGYVVGLTILLPFGEIQPRVGRRCEKVPLGAAVRLTSGTTLQARYPTWLRDSIFPR